MRKIITIIAAILLAAPALNAQSETEQTYETMEHMKFMGVEIGGKLKDFMKKLSMVEGVSVYNDNTAFADLDGRKKVTIIPSETYESKIVYAVDTKYLWSKDWNELTSEYFRLAEVYEEKYGAPDIIREGNIYEKTPIETYNVGKLVNGEIRFERIWHTGNTDSITLTIKPIQLKNWAGIVIRYENGMGKYMNNAEWADTLCKKN